MANWVKGGPDEQIMINMDLAKAVEQVEPTTLKINWGGGDHSMMKFKTEAALTQFLVELLVS